MTDNSSNENGGRVWLWLVNVLVLVVLTIVSWNASRLCDDVDLNTKDIQFLKRQDVRWSIVAEDVKEMKGDLKILINRVQ
jgi:hypothetical protein